MSVDPTILNGVAEVANAVHETAEMAKDVGPIGTFGLNGKIFVAQLVNFTIVLLVLWRFAYRPIVNLIEQREEKIKKSVETAEEIEKRMKESEVERNQLLKDTRVQAQELLEKADAQIETRKKEMVDNARTEVEKVVVQGKQKIAAERDAMMSDVRKEIVGMAILAAEKILVGSVDKKTSEILAGEAIDKAGL